MTALYWAGGILCLLCLLLCLRIRLRLCFDEGGLKLSAGLGPVWLLQIPREKTEEEGQEKQDPKKKKAGKKKKRAKKEKETKGTEEKKGGKVALFRSLLPIITEALGKLRRKLRIDELTFWYLSACDDPAKAALAFGGASAAVGMLLPPLERFLDVRHRDVRTAVSFTEPESTVYVRLRLSLSLWAILYIGVPAGLAFLKAYQAANAAKDTEVN